LLSATRRLFSRLDSWGRDRPRRLARGICGPEVVRFDLGSDRLRPRHLRSGGPLHDCDGQAPPESEVARGVPAKQPSRAVVNLSGRGSDMTVHSARSFPGQQLKRCAGRIREGRHGRAPILTASSRHYPVRQLMAARGCGMFAVGLVAVAVPNTGYLVPAAEGAPGGVSLRLSCRDTPSNSYLSRTGILRLDPQRGRRERARGGIPRPHLACAHRTAGRWHRRR
jgi:hypothetical protein